MKNALFLIVSLSFVAACTSKSSPEQAVDTPQTKPPELKLDNKDWKKQRWIEKVASRLRYGKPLNSSDKLEELVKLSDDEIVAKFMKSEEFGDAVLDFNMYFLGFSVPDLHSEKGGYPRRVYYQASSITAALETLKDGDYLKFLDYEQPIYIGPADTPRKDLPEVKELSDLEARQWYKKATIDNLTEGVKELSREGSNLESVCKILGNLRTNYSINFFNSGFHRASANAMYYNPAWGGRTLDACFDGQPELPKHSLASVQKTLEELPRYIDELIKLSESGYAPKKLTEIVSFDSRKDSFAPQAPFIDKNMFYFKLVNSSTNFNRKRASYMLKRYFCDDLTPINVTIPKEHTGNKHISDPACVSCHYKLDPMAGIFRDIGYLGSDYVDSKLLVLDDMVKIDREKYYEEWKTPEGKFNLGYIRSLEYTEKNDYVESLPQMFEVIKKAPEFRSCLVRRVNEYFISEKQTIDAGYLEELTDLFNKEAQTNSAIAFKNLVARVVKSQAFREDNRNADECYDFPAGAQLNGRPPCKVATVLERNCVGCHSSSSPFGGLVLNKWVKLADGTYNFEHINKNTQQQYSFAETTKRISDRMVTTDEDLRMPKSKFISFKDRETIYLWTQESK